MVDKNKGVCLDWNPVFPMYVLALGRFHNLFVPQVPHLQNGGDINTHLSHGVR